MTPRDELEAMAVKVRRDITKRVLAKPIKDIDEVERLWDELDARTVSALTKAFEMGRALGVSESLGVVQRACDDLRSTDRGTP